ncbi:hypothetical protein COO60DRAFT_496478 [Scenedesmus sp. NREL 46B-D3]|nr:hypothetical protein COO60DRAFT_496478 [Scenedesmus sp. NREL 46B-D3]
MNGSEASKQYLTAFRRLPEEKRRFHPRLAGSFLKEMHIFDGDASLIPERLKQFPGIDATLDEPLAGVCSYEAAAFGLAAPGADKVQLQGPEQVVAAGRSSAVADGAPTAALEDVEADKVQQLTMEPVQVLSQADLSSAAAGAHASAVHLTGAAAEQVQTAAEYASSVPAQDGSGAGYQQQVAAGSSVGADSAAGVAAAIDMTAADTEQLDDVALASTSSDSNSITGEVVYTAPAGKATSSSSSSRSVVPASDMAAQTGPSGAAGTAGIEGLVVQAIVHMLAGAAAWSALVAARTAAAVQW